ncbi:MAG: alpha-mannosidase, partial [Clostridia bacterium]|nr:alpha-mannosidase [Clostridia bacterium]
KTYMFCNAHLDPVWLWQWESGMSEAISTFRSAARLIDEYPDFIFNHNESLLYEWVEEHEPALFEKIREQVKAGRWKIVGGWFLQPDCNIPAGESILRQILRGRIYFYDKFGEVPVTAVNFDSFGHAQGLVQVLTKCGYRHYVNIRPGRGNYDFPNEDFRWIGYDGSEILVHRSDKGYNSVLGQAAAELLGDGERPGWLERHKDEENALYLWGVGNHGGGPSRKDLDDIAALQASGVDLVHSTPDEYFAAVERDSLPVVNRGLNHLMEGCYTSIIRIKQLHRRLENDLVMTEAMATHAAIAGLSVYDREKLDDAWRDLLFSEFHDSLPGSCIQPVEEDMIRMLHHGLEITNKLKSKYFLALCAGQEPVEDGETVPILLYNPHPFPFTQPVDVEFLLPRQMWHKDFSNPVAYVNGVRVPCQQAKESGNFYMDWCKRILIEHPLAPFSVTRFDVKFEILPSRPMPTVEEENRTRWEGRERWENRNRIVVDTARGQVAVNTRTGLVDSYTVDGEELLSPGALSLEVFEDAISCWDGHPNLDLRYPEGRFTLMTPGEATDFSGVKGSVVRPVRAVEEGDILTVIEADMKYGHSRALVRYLIGKISGALEVEVRVFWAENEKRLKLRIPTVFESGEHWGMTMFGREKLRPGSRGEDTFSQYWQAVTDGTRALTVIDDGVYGSDFKDGVLRVTLLRSAGYGSGRSAWGEPFHEPMYQQRMDQGERRYRFRLMGGEREERLLHVDREAAMWNRIPYGFAFCPSGEGVKPLPLCTVDAENIVLSCFKRSEREADAWILRLYEAQGIPSTAHVDLPAAGLSFDADFAPFAIRTYRIRDGRIEECDLLEGSVPLPVTPAE